MAGKLNKELKEIQKLVELLGKDIDRLTFERLTEDTKFAAQYARDLRDELNATIGETDSLSSGWRNIQEEITNGSQSLRDMNSSMGSLKSISEKLENIKSGITKADEKTLEKLQEQFKSEEKKIGSLRSGLALSQETLRQKLKTGNISQAEISQLAKINTALGEATSIITRNNGLFEETRNTLNDIDNLNEEIDHKLGALPGLASGLDNILGKIGIKGIGFGKALEDAKKQAQESGDATKIWGNYTSNLGKQFKNLLSPANILSGIIIGLTKGFMESQKGIGDLAKGLGMSASRATVMRQEFADIANLSMNANLTVKDLQDTQLAVGQALGTNAMLNEKDLETMTDIVKKTGLQHSELIGIEKLSLATGKSLDDNVEAALGGATAFASQNKLVVDNNRVLREVNKASSSLKLSLGGSVEELGKAVVQAQKFGINLEQAESIASSMLDFESSIEAELSAELLTGKNLNLERARQLALEGDIASAAEEVLKQLEGSEEFSKMNVIQQEAMAKAVGLTRDQLASSLIEREALAKMSAQEGESALQAYERLKAQGKTQSEIVALLGEKAAGDLEQQSAQEKFNNSIEKLKEIFTQVMDALAPIFDMLSSIAEIVMPAINFLLSPLIEGFSLVGKAVSSFVKGLKEGKGPAIALAAILGTMAAPLIASAIGAIFKSFASIPFGIGIPLAGIAVAGLFSLLSKGESKAKQVSDAAIDPKGGLIVSGPKGTYQGDPNDTIIMGTGIGKGKGKTTPQQGGGGGTVNIDMTQTNALLQQLINVIQTGGNVMLDGQKVGTALKLGSFKTQ